MSTSRIKQMKIRMTVDEMNELKSAVKESGTTQQNYVLSKLFANFVKPANEEVCPMCGGRLLVKHGHKGVFLGCENFPSCSYAQSINKGGVSWHSGKQKPRLIRISGAVGVIHRKNFSC